MNDELDIGSLIEDSAKVIAVAGRWPTFHDAEILTIVLDRGLTFASRSQSLTAEIYDVINSSIVKLQFTKIDLESLDDFNHQNSIWGVEIATCDDERFRFAVTVDGTNGCSFRLKCDGIRVLDIRPAPPRGG